MLKRGKMDRDVVEIVGIDSLVPKEHLLRKIDIQKSLEMDLTRRVGMISETRKSLI